MTAAEEQKQGVVSRLCIGRLRLPLLEQPLLASAAGGVAAADVDQPPGRDRRQPRLRVARRVLGPRPQRLQQRLLQRVLGGVEILAPPDQAREHPRDEGAQRALVQLSRRLVGHAGSVLHRRPGHDLADVDPLVERLPARAGLGGDRKSTRLNSSHVKISYAVFCLKKKKKTECMLSLKKKQIQPNQ